MQVNGKKKYSIKMYYKIKKEDTNNNNISMKQGTKKHRCFNNNIMDLIIYN